MDFIIWDDQLSVGLTIFDDQHKNLIKIINTLYQSIESGDDSETQEKILGDLILYTVTHFTEEEKYFAQFNYPDKEQHKKEHDGFCKVIKEYSKDYYSGKQLKNIDILKFLVGWLKNHIINSDKKYSNFFVSKGLS